MPIKTQEELNERITVDRSPITTMQVWIQVAALKELMITKIASIENAIHVSHEDMVRVPTEVQKQVGGLKELMETKISYENQITTLRFAHAVDHRQWIETMRIEHKQDTNKAVEAALAAAKEAVDVQNKSNLLAINKSEAATTKQFDQLGALVAAMGKSLDDKINDIKERISGHTGEQSGRDRQTERGTIHFNAMIGWLIAVVSIIVSVVMYMNK